MRYVFKDTESSGTDVRYDQIFQFAAIRTDDALNELEVVDLRCRRLPHVLPNPVALAVTNVDPWTLKDNPLSPFEMACRIHAKMQEWSPATFLGHNTLGFDEEIERSTFWLNLLDPYVSNTNGSARADTLVILRVAHALRPGILSVRVNPETGSPILKLESLAADNGFEAHKAHDALGDIRANIHVAKIVKNAAPDIWSSLMRNTAPAAVDKTLAGSVVLMMTHFGKAQFFPAVRVAMNPGNKRQALMLDLSRDFRPWLAMSPEEIADGIFSKESPFQTLKTNAMPTVFAADDPIVAERWREAAEATPDLQERRFEAMSHPTFVVNCLEALKLRNAAFQDGDNVEEQIYGGFPSWDDKRLMKAIHAAGGWSERAGIARRFAKSGRLGRIAERLLWCEAPELLDSETLKSLDERLVAERVLGPATQAGGKPSRWCTLAAARADMAQIAGHPLEARIAAWFDALEAAVTADPAAIRSFG